jgi:hypothetical protein
LASFNSEKPVTMSTPDAVLFLDSDFLERRSKKRTTINHGAALFLAGHPTVYTCWVRDVTNAGAGIQLNGLNIVPSEFEISFDNFRTMRRCRLTWRDGDFIGAKFES